MGLVRLQAIFDEQIHYSGRPISGKVFLDVDSPKKIRGIEVKFKGECQIRWKYDGSGTHTCKANESYLTNRMYIHGDGEDEIEIPEGHHIFPFNWVLPPNIPCSFGSFHGKIRYSIKVVVDRPWKFDHVIKVPFTVAPLLDLNYIPYAREAVQETSHKTFWRHAEPIAMTVILPARGYVPGQEIPVKAKLENYTEVNVEKLKIVLQKVITFHASSEKHVRKEEICHLEVNLEEGQDEASTNLRVPPLPPSFMPYCNLIDVAYILKVEACVEGWYLKNLKVKTDILIGTVPLVSFHLPGRSARPVKLCSSENDDEDYAEVEPSFSNDHRDWKVKPTFKQTKTYRSTKPERDEEAIQVTDSDSDEEIAEAFSPMYPVYDFDSLFADSKKEQEQGT